MNGILSLLIWPAFVASICGATWLAIVRWQFTARCVIPLAVAVLLLPVSFSAGSLWGQLHNNYCYAATIEALGEAAASAARAGRRDDLLRFAGSVKGLPLWGYETECGRVRAGVAALQGPAGR